MTWLGLGGGDGRDWKERAGSHQQGQRLDALPRMGHVVPSAHQQQHEQPVGRRRHSDVAQGEESAAAFQSPHQVRSLPAPVTILVDPSLCSSVLGDDSISFSPTNGTCSAIFHLNLRILTLLNIIWTNFNKKIKFWHKNLNFNTKKK